MQALPPGDEFEFDGLEKPLALEELAWLEHAGVVIYRYNVFPEP